MLIDQSVLRLMPYRLRKILNARVRVSLMGHKLVIPIGSNNEGLQNVFWTRSWKTEIIERLVDTGMGVFVDVGANVGQTLLDLHLTHPKTPYVGFEPNVTCANYLKDLIRSNAFQNYSIIPAGLADESKIVPLYRHKDSPTDLCATILSDLRPGRSYDVDFISCYKFDDIRQSLGQGNIGFVKIDVEGAELEVLIGMRMSLQEFRPLILCEVLFSDSKADPLCMKSRNDRLMQLLTPLRYAVLQLIKSADGAHIVEAKKIDTFPSAFWSVENKDLCDYLLVPSEKEGHALNALLKESRSR
jgi:FkbM family methyltransferase